MSRGSLRIHRRRRSREAGFLVTLEFLLIATIILFLLILVWTSLRGRIIARLEEIKAATKAQDQRLQRAPVVVKPAAPEQRPASDPQVLEDPEETYGVRFGPPPTLGVPRLAPPPPPE